MKTRIIGIVSVKGGVGKTSVTSNLGAVLAENFGKKVLLVDGNFFAPNLGMHLGVIDPEHTIHHVLKGDKHIFACVYDYEDKFHFIPGMAQAKKVKWNSFRKKLKALRGKYDYILIDASPSKEIQAVIDSSDEMLVVVTPDYPTVSSAVNTVNMIEKHDKKVMGLILNKWKKRYAEVYPNEIEEALGYNVISCLPEDRKSMKSLSQMEPFTLMYPNRKLTRKYLKLGERITGEKPVKKGFLFARFIN